MKKLSFLVSVLIVSIAVFASPVDPTRALQIAQEFVPQQKASTQRHNAPAAIQKGEIVYTHYMPKSGKPAIYVINIGNGFALVSADDVAHPILGYNYGKAWPKNGEFLPPSVKGFLDDLAAQMEGAAENPQDAETAEEWKQPRKAPRRTKMNDNLPDSVGPLLTTTWDQGQYYNSLCPEDGQSQYDGHVPTGCVATAMAQIIKYWGDKQEIKTRGIHSYESNYGTLRVNYDSTSYDFAQMPNALTSESTPEQVNAVASLMRDCGVAVNMQYSPTESSSLNQDARAALINFYHFSPDLSFAEKSFFSDDEWNNMLKQDIASGKPVYYSGRNDNNSGHAFICNGYQKDGYFYFNFGWSGLADGWYLTNAVLGYTSAQAAIFGIIPDNAGNVILGQTAGTSTFRVDEPLDFYHFLGHNKYKVENYINSCNNVINFIPANQNDKLVADILEFDDQELRIYDGPEYTNLLRNLYGGSDNDLSPIVSPDSMLTFIYTGNLYNTGFQLQISLNSNCRMISNILTAIDTTTVHLSWTENGTATQWQVEYGEKGFEHGEGTVISVDNTMVHITFPKKLTIYDVYIRSICEENEYGAWNKVTVQSEAPYWQDIVTSKPASYTINEETNYAIISTPEDFVWFMQRSNYSSLKGAIFVSDIDMSGYKWHPNFDDYPNFNIKGGGYSIKNLYIKEPNRCTALFPYFAGNIEDLGIENAQVYGKDGVSALCGEFNSLGRIINCHVSNSMIQGTDMVAGMAAYCYGNIENCYVNIDVQGNRWTGLMTGYSQGIIKNCYSAGTIELRSYCYYAGISAYAATGKISNCYSVDLPMGVIGYKGLTIISDTSSFYEKDDIWNLRTPIEFDGTIETNLIEALNAQVVQLNDSNLRMWIKDNDLKNEGLPLFGNHLVVHYPNVSNLTVRNLKINNISCVVVNWEENGDAETWEIKYQPVNTPWDSAIIVSTASKPDTIYGLKLAREYTISVRSIYKNNHHSGWESVTEMIDLPFWTEIVNEKPEGYAIDTMGNVTISTSEGLAWLSCVVNGLHGAKKQSFNGKIVSLVADINLQGCRWTPIGSDGGHPFCGTFLGDEHTISNLYINSPGTCLGLFGYATNDAKFANVTIKHGYVNSYFCDVDGGGYGGLLGKGHEVKEIIDCKSDAVVMGTMQLGSLCGWLSDYEGEATVVSNCSATGDVYGRESTAGLIGEARGIVVQNCYATGSVYLKEGNWNAWYRGGLIGNFMSNSVVENCYATGSVEIDENSSQWYGRVIGCPYMSSEAHYVYGKNGDLPFAGHSSTGDVMTDTSSFVITDNQQILLTPITINDSTYENLLDALNAWVTKTNDPTFKTWVIDSTKNMGYPILGNNYEPTCFNPTDVTVSNATKIGDTIISTKIAWEQQGDATSWEILYTVPQHGIDSGVIISINSNPCILTELPIGQLLDFYVRAVCDDSHKSGWSKPYRYIPDKLLWTEVVTTEPEGYQEDGHGNVFISSAEGLAWLAYVVNRLSDNQNYNANITNICLMADINLSAYRWEPIYSLQNCVFAGNGHKISGLYCNSNDSKQGLIGRASYCDLKNVTIFNSSIKGLLDCGILVGYAEDSNIKNCLISGDVSAVMEVGGIAGILSNSSIYNSGYVGVAVYRNDLSLPNMYHGFVGGIAGGANNSKFENLYVASEIPESAFSGIITSVGSAPQLVVNSYYKKYSTSLPVTYIGCETNNVSSFDGSDTSWTLNAPPYINGAFYSDLVEALNAWVYANNTDGKYRHWVADTANINGGFPIYAPLPKYLITFVDEDGTILQKDTVEQGSMPVYTNPVPTKTATAQYTYTFAGWTPEVIAVTGNATYTATFDSIVNKYTIIFKNGDEVLQSTEVEYGVVPSYDGTTPTKTATAQYTYTFAGWAPEIVSVIGEAIYSATFDSIVNKYTITFVDEDETILSKQELEYNTMPVPPTDPVKQGDAQYSYTFAGWTPKIVAVTEDATYKATYNKLTKKYTITFLNDDNSILSSKLWFYGETPTCEQPTKEEDAEYTYTFAGWNPEIVMVTEDASYVATYNATKKSEAIDEVNANASLRKILYNGQIFILRGEKVYTLTGQEVR